MKHLIQSTALISVMATVAAAQTQVSKIDVVADLSALQTYEAASAWKNLETDLETAIAERLVSQIAPEDVEGAEIEIELDEVTLANNFETAIGVGEWKLVGDVDLDMPDASKDENYTLTVSTDQIRTFYPEGTNSDELSVDSDVFYQAVVAAFADNVASKLK
ncbi:hypothetical protein GS634_21865 [Ruegeria atlantica]|uniref:Uncharacterized protein n=1 Tax=Ruegeria atlantica TaxID=81569 RepID=A0AA91C0W1_9RHOB|nr:hypothetical protein [Ruegeria atlantica]NOE20786.1 hypothetical protein [Ruegeria atlantica]